VDSKVIRRTWSDSEAELIRGLLESYGIPCSVISDITHSVYPLTVNGLGEIRLAVPAEAAEEAERILAEHQTSAPEESAPTELDHDEAEGDE
jgi:Putative prokaryotic signal transducing protein